MTTCGAIPPVLGRSPRTVETVDEEDGAADGDGQGEVSEQGHEVEEEAGEAEAEAGAEPAEDVARALGRGEPARAEGVVEVLEGEEEGGDASREDRVEQAERREQRQEQQRLDQA